MPELKFQTKQKRLVAIVDHYRELSGKGAVTMEEVSLWSMLRGLYPVPKRGCSVEDAADFERRLAEAKYP